MQKFNVGDILVGNQNSPVNNVVRGDFYEVVESDSKTSIIKVKPCDGSHQAEWVFTERFDLHEPALTVGATVRVNESYGVRKENIGQLAEIVYKGSTHLRYRYLTGPNAGIALHCSNHAWAGRFTVLPNIAAGTSTYSDEPQESDELPKAPHTGVYFSHTGERQVNLRRLQGDRFGGILLTINGEYPTANMTPETARALASDLYRMARHLEKEHAE